MNSETIDIWPAGAAPMIRDIQEVVCAQHGVRMHEMLSDRRSRYVARPRQLAMALSRELTSRSLPEIGRFFGNRDHTTVMHAIRQVEASSDPKTQDDIQRAVLGVALLVANRIPAQPENKTGQAAFQTA